MTRPIDPSDIAMLRGVRNCGGHHEENATAPAIQFAQACEGCSKQIFGVIFNAGIEALMCRLRAAEVVR